IPSLIQPSGGILLWQHAKWHLNRSQFGIRIDHDLAVFFKVVVAFCNKITLCSLFFWIQVDF
ncbi:TPA: hypothetical protein ACG5PC_005068, partial [Escherichia coli]